VYPFVDLSDNDEQYSSDAQRAAVSYARAYTEESGDYTHDTYNTKFRNDLGNNG